MMSLPNLAPTDCHTLWYTSTNHSAPHPPPLSPSHSNHGQHPPSPQSLRRAAPSRTPHHQLLASETLLAARKSNIQNWGLTYLRPPGVLKSLHQLREERREMDEHAEALRREQRALELAEAEMGIAGVGGGAMELEMGMGLEGPGEEETGLGERNLDDDVPDLDTTRLDASSSASPSPSSSGEDVDAQENGDGETEGNPTRSENLSSDVPPAILATRMPDSIYREALLHGGPMQHANFALSGETEMSDDEDQDVNAASMLQEEDLMPSQPTRMGMHTDMHMDIDLDDEIPDADDVGEEYEHTDTEDELLSSSEAALEAEAEAEAEAEDQGPGRRIEATDGAFGFGAAAVAEHMESQMSMTSEADGSGNSLVRSDGTQGSSDLGRVSGLEWSAGRDRGGTWGSSGMGSPRPRQRDGRRRW